MATMALEERSGPLTNVGDVERVGSTLAGAALVLAGLARGGLGGRGVALAGVGLVARGVTGRCPMYDAMGREPESYRRPVRVVEQMQVGISPAEAYDGVARPRALPPLHAAREERDGDGRDVALGGPVLGPARDRVGRGADQGRAGPGASRGVRRTMRSRWRRRAASPSSTWPTAAPGLRVEIGYYPPAGALGRTAARLFGPVSEQQVREDVRRFKSLMEAGETPTTEGQPTGKGWKEVTR